MRDVVTARAVHTRTARGSWADVCASLMEVCKICQHEVLDPRGISCLFDVDSGVLSAWRCNILGRIVRSLIDEIVKDARAGKCGGRITVALHRKGEVWVLAVADEGIRTFDRNVTVGVAPCVMHLARPLKGSSRCRLTARGALTAILFTATYLSARVGGPTRDDDAYSETEPGRAHPHLPMGLHARGLPRRVFAH